MQTLLIYPHLILFAYSLREKSEGKEISQDSSWEVLRNRLNVPETADFNPERDYAFKLENVEGFYQRVPLGDTDSLMVACSTKDEDKPTEDLRTSLQIFKKKLDLQANIGKTWVILGYLDSSSEAEREKAAKVAYQAFRGNQEEPKLKPGNYFLGCSIFQVWETPEDWLNLTESNDLVLICICPYRKTLDRIAAFYYDWLWLFYYRHKILWAYRNSRIIKNLLEQEDLFPRASTIPEINVNLPSLDLASADLQQIKIDLHKNLVTLSKHTAGLESLALQLHTLQTNLHNYQIRLEKIKANANNEVGITKLKFLEDFSESIALRYEGQIERDRASLSPGLRVREKYIDTIRGIVEVTQAERDRRLERNITIVGFGIGAASTAASAISPFVETITERPTISEQKEAIPGNAWFNFWYGFGVSITVGVLFAAATWLGWKVAQQMRSNLQKRL